MEEKRATNSGPSDTIFSVAISGQNIAIKSLTNIHLKYFDAFALNANEILQLEILRQNHKVSRSTGKIPEQVCADALLDLHLSLRTSGRVNHDHTIDFEGRNYEISATKRKSVTIVHHPNTKFWVLEHPPKDVWPSVLRAFSL